MTDSLVPSTGLGVIDARGLPGYTFECASGELWRSRIDATRNVIVVNNGHRDFVFASRTQALKLRYLVAKRGEGGVGKCLRHRRVTTLTFALRLGCHLKGALDDRGNKVRLA